MKEIKVSLGSWAKPLHEQLGVKESETLNLQNFADCICTLALHGLLTPTETRAARNRLMIKIAAQLGMKVR
jgi:hypothetical protein